MPSDTLRLSLVIPVYNEADTIGLCLDHIVAQTHPIDEVVVVDNNSSDGTKAVVERYLERLPLRIVDEKTQGVRSARTTGFEEASGDVVGRIDADTRLDPQWTRRLRAFFEENADVSGVMGATYPYDSPLDGPMYRSAVKLAKTSVRRGDMPAPGLYGANCALRKTAWTAARQHLLDEDDLHEDLDLYYGVVGSGGVVRFLPTLLAGQSARRFAASFGSNLRYLHAAFRTRSRHGDKKGVAVLCLTYIPNLINLIVMRVLVAPFDPVSRRWSLRNVRSSRVSPVSRA
jgi:glycosyltransferase involved in cell wall biosynthesis